MDRPGLAARVEPSGDGPAGTLRDLGTGNPDPALIPDLAPALAGAFCASAAKPL